MITIIFCCRSYGILLFEIFYNRYTTIPQLNNEEFTKILKKGDRLEKPDQISKHLYQVLLEC
jgi:hypothetical protein